MIIEGKNAVSEALKGNVTIEKVMVQKDVQNKGIFQIVKECRERRITVHTVEKSALDRLSPSGRHQGVLAISTEFTYSEFDELLENKSEKGLLIILLDGIEDPHNLGAIIRVAECAGADGIIIPRRRSCGVTDTAVKVSSGASSYVKIAKVANINDAVRELKERGVTVFAADMDGECWCGTDLDCSIGIVIGSEGAGVGRLIKEKCDGVLSLPMKGKINSLNASVAAGVILYEAARQRSGISAFSENS